MLLCCLCISSLAAEDPDVFEASAQLPDINITRAPSEDGIMLMAAEAIGWSQMIIRSGSSYTRSTGAQEGTALWSWSNLVNWDWFNNTLVPDYTYSFSYIFDKSDYDPYWHINGINGSILSDYMDLSTGDVIAGSGYTVQLQAEGTKFSGYKADKAQYMICLISEYNEVIKIITASKSSTSQTWKSNQTSMTQTFTFPDYSFQADQDYGNVRLCFWAGATRDPSSSTKNMGAFSLQALPGNAVTVYLKASVVEGSGAGQDDTSGLLAGIIEWLQNIYDGVTSIVSAILSLPGQIANLIIEGLKTLFIPDQDEISALFTGFSDWLDQNFPLLVLPLTLVTWLVSFIQGTAAEAAVIKFPEIKWMGHVLIPETPFNFSDIPILETLLPYIRFFSTLAVLWAFALWVKRKIHSYWSDGGNAE